MSALMRRALTWAFDIRIYLTPGKKLHRWADPIIDEAVQALYALSERDGIYESATEIAAMLNVPEDVAAAALSQIRTDLLIEAREGLEAEPATQKLELAVRCLPPSHRARYRREWRAELASLPPSQWVTFSASLLATAPQTSTALLHGLAIRRRT